MAIHSGRDPKIHKNKPRAGNLLARRIRNQVPGVSQMSELSPRERLASYITGYFASQCVYVAAELRLADHLTMGPRTVDDLSHATGTHPRSLYRLLRALASLGIFQEEDDGRFAMTATAEELRSDAQRATALMMGGEFYHAWGDLLNSIRTGEPAFPRLNGMTCFEFLASHTAQGENFDKAMTALNDRKTQAILDVYDFSDVRLLADIGGGNGSTLIRILERYPALYGVLFDLAEVAGRARLGLELAGLAHRCVVSSGSFLDSVPKGADVYLFRHILHNWDDPSVEQILRNTRDAMDPGAKLLVVERIIPPGNDPLFGKLQDLTMLVVHGGLERTEAEFRQLFEQTGFRLTRIVPTAQEVCLIEGKRTD